MVGGHYFTISEEKPADISIILQQMLKTIEPLFLDAPVGCIG